MIAAVLFLLGLLIGWAGRDLWSFAVELFELYREQR